jgi:hypothetical protein
MKDRTMCKVKVGGKQEEATPKHKAVEAKGNRACIGFFGNKDIGRCRY